MRSERPKPLHVLCGRPMLGYVLDAMAAASVGRAAVVTGSDPRVRKRIEDDPPRLSVQFVASPETPTMGSAALTGTSALEELHDDDDVIVVPADVPLLTGPTVSALFDHHVSSGAAMTVLTERVDPAAPGPRLTLDRHGRIDGSVSSPVGDLELRPLSLWVVRRSLLAAALRRLSPLADNTMGLTPLVDVLADSGHPVAALQAPKSEEMLEVVSRATLAIAEGTLRRRTNATWLARGVTMVDPDRTYVDTTVLLGTDVTLFPGTILRGETVIGDGSEIGPDTTVDRCHVGERSVVEKTVARGATIGSDARVGPFAVLEPGAVVASGATTGPFYAG